MRLFGRAAGAVAFLLVAASGALAAQVTVTDVAGRAAEVETPLKRAILGEERQIYFVAALERETSFEHIVGRRDDLAKADPETCAVQLEKYPKVTRLPSFGGMKDGNSDVEQAVSLEPVVILTNLDAKTATEAVGYIGTPKKVGIPLVHADFREKPMVNRE